MIDVREPPPPEVFDDDAALKAWIERLGGKGCRTPYVRASVYRNQEIERDQEFSWDLASEADPRRPVLMRGARWLCVSRHCDTPGGGSPNGWVRRAFCRWLRMRKVTALHPDDWHRIQALFIAMARKKYRGISYHCFWNWQPFSLPAGLYLVNGESVFLDKAQHAHIEKLLSLRSKVDRLRDQVA